MNGVFVVSRQLKYRLVVKKYVQWMDGFTNLK